MRYPTGPKSLFRRAPLPLALEKLEDRTVPAFTAALTGGAAVFTGDANADTLEFSQVGNFLQHNRFTAGDPGFVSNLDFDSTVAGEQKLASDFVNSSVAVNAGAGNDLIIVGSAASPAATVQAKFVIDGQDGSDVVHFQNATDPTGRTITVDGTARQVSIANTVSITHTSAEFVQVFAGTGNDILDVTGAAQTGVDLFAGAGDDVIRFATGAAVGGAVDGQAGTDTLDYSQSTAPVAVNLGVNAPSLVATLGADQESPATTSPAFGDATVNYNNVTRTLTVNVTVNGIAPADVTGFHIHRAAFGENGPIIVPFDTGTLTPTATGFQFNAVGLTLDPLHEAALLGGLTYVNVHTGEFPAGAIRGQLVPSGPMVVAPGTATGTGTVANVENATGGSGSFEVSGVTFGDGLVGSTLANVLRGGAGNDVLVGAQGNDTLQGEDGNDILVWSNGDNNDVMDGGAGADLVQVNGAVDKGDVFTIGAGPGGRLAFNRANLVPFALDIGTTEGLTVVGYGGDDQFSQAALTGVADLTELTLAGLAGSDTFNVIPQAAVGITVLGGLPETTTGGDTLNADVTGLVNASLTSIATGTEASRTGRYAASARQAVEFAGIETLNPLLPPPAVLVGEDSWAVGADDGGSPSVRQFDDAQNQLLSIVALDPSFSGGVRVASADFNGDGVPDLVVGSGPGVATLVKVIDGKTQTELFSITPFEASFTGGVYVAAGDVTGDGVPDLIITPDEGGGPRVRIFSGSDFKLYDDFFGIEDPAFRGGARAAVADVTGDGIGDVLVAAGFLGGPRVAVWDGASLGDDTTRTKPFPDFFMFEETLRNGVFIAGGDLNGDGFADIIAGGGPGGGPRVRALSGLTLQTSGAIQNADELPGAQLANFFAGDPANRGGIRITAKNLDGDNRTDLIAGDGEDAGSLVTGYLGANIPINGDPSATEFSFEAFPGFSGGVFVG